MSHKTVKWCGYDCPIIGSAGPASMTMFGKPVLEINGKKVDGFTSISFGNLAKANPTKYPVDHFATCEADFTFTEYGKSLLQAIWNGLGVRMGRMGDERPLSCPRCGQAPRIQTLRVGGRLSSYMSAPHMDGDEWCEGFIV